MRKGKGIRAKAESKKHQLGFEAKLMHEFFALNARHTLRRPARVTLGVLFIALHVPTGFVPLAVLRCVSLNVLRRVSLNVSALLVSLRIGHCKSPSRT